MGLVRSCPRRFSMAIVLALAGQAAWAMQPGKDVPAPNPAGKADAQRIAAALRQGSADYAAFKAKVAVPQGKEPVQSGVIDAASKVAPADQKARVAALKEAMPDLQVRFGSRTGSAVHIKAANLHTAGRLRALSLAGRTAAAAASPPLADITDAASEDGLDTLAVYQGPAQDRGCSPGVHA